MTEMETRKLNGPVAVRLRSGERDAWVWDGKLSESLKRWLGDHFIDWVYNNGELLISVEDGNGNHRYACAGQMLVMRPGYLMLCSPDAADELFELAQESGS